MNASKRYVKTPKDKAKGLISNVQEMYFQLPKPCFVISVYAVRLKRNCPTGARRWRVPEKKKKKKKQRKVQLIGCLLYLTQWVESRGVLA